jgi:hypothetical protein
MDNQNRDENVGGKPQQGGDPQSERNKDWNQGTPQPGSNPSQGGSNPSQGGNRDVDRGGSEGQGSGGGQNR